MGLSRRYSNEVEFLVYLTQQQQIKLTLHVYGDSHLRRTYRLLSSLPFYGPESAADPGIRLGERYGESFAQAYGDLRA